MIMKLLHLDSSPLNGASVSRGLTRSIVDQVKREHPAINVTYRDLAAQPPAHLSADTLAARSLQPEQQTEAQRREAEVTETLLAEFLAADVVVVGAPMYNFSVPSQLKAWIDRVAQAGRTFQYTDKGPVGLAGNKRVIIASTRGGAYSDSDAGRAMDFQEDYLRTVFGFLGITDVSVVRAEGVNVGPEVRARALQAAQAQIARLSRGDERRAA